jgi:hypothetical protein
MPLEKAMSARKIVAAAAITLVAGLYFVWQGRAVGTSKGAGTVVGFAGQQRGNPASAAVSMGEVGRAPYGSLPSAAPSEDVVGHDEGGGREARHASIEHATSWAAEFEAARMNIFRDDDDFVRKLIARDEHAVGRLTELLEEGPDVDRNSQQLGRGPPTGEVKARMGAVNLLETIARVAATEESARDAQGALRAIGTREIAPGMSPAAKAVMVGEKYDALVSLTRIDPRAAFDAFRSITQPERRKVLAPALMAGLVDRGVERSQVVAEFNRLLGE